MRFIDNSVGAYFPLGHSVDTRHRHSVVTQPVYCQLEGHTVERMYLRRLTGSVSKTIVKPRVAAAANTYTSDFPDVKFRVPALLYDNGESNPVPASGL